MPGFSNITGQESIMYADNASFNGTERGGKMTTDGQLWIGSTSLPHVKLGNITSLDSSVGVSNSSGTIDLSIVGLAYVQPSAYPYTVLSTDYFISVDSSSARTINLPNAPNTRKTYVIKDRVGSAGANNITITTPGGAVLIDAAAIYTLNSNYGSISVIFNGTSYEVF